MTHGVRLARKRADAGLESEALRELAASGWTAGSGGTFCEINTIWFLEPKDRE